MPSSMLSQIRFLTVVDLDCMDADVAKQYTYGNEKFCDMTSNQAIVYFEAAQPNRQSMIQTAIQYARSKKKEQSEERTNLDILDAFTVLLGKEVAPYITGNVMAQTSPSFANDLQETIYHAQRLVEVFGDHGIPRERVCIKIPATPASLLACQVLEKSGIKTLATTLFSLPQAIAASQAGCQYIAPYFHELRVHFQNDLWKEWKDFSTHPVHQSTRSIIDTFKLIKSKTMVMPASLVHTDEVVALVSLRPHHITLSKAILDQLAVLPPTPLLEGLEDPVVASESLANFPDYLANDGAALKVAIDSEAETARKVHDALKIFDDMEKKTVELIRPYLQ